MARSPSSSGDSRGEGVGQRADFGAATGGVNQATWRRSSALTASSQPGRTSSPCCEKNNGHGNASGAKVNRGGAPRRGAVSARSPDTPTLYPGHASRRQNFFWQSPNGWGRFSISNVASAPRSVFTATRHRRAELRKRLPHLATLSPRDESFARGWRRAGNLWDVCVISLAPGTWAG
jgi:hypothetical protein